MQSFSKPFAAFLLIAFAAVAARAEPPSGGWTGLYGGVSGTLQGATSTTTGTNTYTTQEIVVDPTGTPTGTPSGGVEEARVLESGQTTRTVIQTEAIADRHAKTTAGAGLRVGYNYQTGPVVLGAEGDIHFAGFTSGGYTLGDGVAGPNEGYATVSHSTVVGTVRARAGMAFDKILLFGTGGLALTDLRNSVVTNSGFVDSRHQTAGWTGGGGAEIRVSPRVSIAATVLYADFGKTTLGTGDGTSSFNAIVKTHYVIGSLGVNTRF